MDSAIYQLLAVKKNYAGRTVLNLENLEVFSGEILAVVGPSGAGKSTLLRLLNFLEYPDQGSLTYAGRMVTPALPLVYRREVTTVFQKPALLNDNVENNVGYGLWLRREGWLGRNRDEIHASARRAMHRLGLDILRRAQARTLSGGEAQRVALARAMVLHPRVLLLDEPTANLDPYNIGLIEEVVREMNQEDQVTVVLVTHNIFQARRLADRIVLLLNGQVVESAVTHDFFEHPTDPRTKAFVNGEMVY